VSQTVGEYSLTLSQIAELNLDEDVKFEVYEDGEISAFKRTRDAKRDSDRDAGRAVPEPVKEVSNGEPEPVKAHPRRGKKG